MYIPKGTEKSKEEIDDQVRACDRIDASNKTDQSSVKSAQKRMTGFLKFDIEDEFHRTSKFALICQSDSPVLMTAEEIAEREKNKDKAPKQRNKSAKNAKAGLSLATIYHNESKCFFPGAGISLIYQLKSQVDIHLAFTFFWPSGQEPGIAG